MGEGLSFPGFQQGRSLAEGGVRVNSRGLRWTEFPPSPRGDQATLRQLAQGPRPPRSRGPGRWGSRCRRPGGVGAAGRGPAPPPPPLLRLARGGGRVRPRPLPWPPGCPQRRSLARGLSPGRASSGKARPRAGAPCRLRRRPGSAQSSAAAERGAAGGGARGRGTGGPRGLAGGSGDRARPGSASRALAWSPRAAGRRRHTVAGPGSDTQARPRPRGTLHSEAPAGLA